MCFVTEWSGFVMLNEVKHLAREREIGAEFESGNPSQARSFAALRMTGGRTLLHSRHRPCRGPAIQDDKTADVASFAMPAAPRPGDSG
jgi:hypothetical protein